MGKKPNFKSKSKTKTKTKSKSKTKSKTKSNLILTDEEKEIQELLKKLEAKRKRYIRNHPGRGTYQTEKYKTLFNFGGFYKQGKIKFSKNVLKAWFNKDKLKEQLNERVNNRKFYSNIIRKHQSEIKGMLLKMGMEEEYKLVSHMSLKKIDTLQQYKLADIANEYKDFLLYELESASEQQYKVEKETEQQKASIRKAINQVMKKRGK